MATLIFSAVGNAVGGSIGSTIGALIGNQIDHAIFGKGGGREGPRLKELAITTSSYGTPLPRQFGTVRVPGSVIWSTDLVESSETAGGGKSQPSVTTYSYSVSFAVALSSRRIESVGRIWADGNLLRGSAGDIKVGGVFRLYRGHADQQPDPLLASAQGGNCPAFRGLAYCVFESLQLADFGNRIPALTFEVIADTGDVTLLDLLSPVAVPLSVDRELTRMKGFSDEGGPLSGQLASIAQLYPLSCDASGQSLALGAADLLPATLPLLPAAVTDAQGESFGAATGRRSRRLTDASSIPGALRYYDRQRDYQAGLQRVDGRALTSTTNVLELPATFDPADARSLINQLAERASWQRDTLAWRMAEIDPAIGPGRIVAVPDRAGAWRIDSWEWRETGIELELSQVPPIAARAPTADPGAVQSAADFVATPTLLQGFELPWSGVGSADEPQIFAAASSASRGWTGAALYAEHDGTLAALGSTGPVRAITGALASSLPASQCALIDRHGAIDVQLDSDDFMLVSASILGIANGANRALVGREVLQFAAAEPRGAGLWRLTGLLRGRGGTERIAAAGQPSGRPFALLDQKLVPLASAGLGSAARIAAIGIADSDAVIAPLRGLGRTLKPLTPVHPHILEEADGSIILGWTRRARGAWTWPDETETPLNEQVEAYQVGVGPSTAPTVYWITGSPHLALDPTTVDNLKSSFAGAVLWVRQQGSHAQSDPLYLMTL